MSGKTSVSRLIGALLGSLVALTAFAGAASAASPTIEREWVTGITPTSAVLHAEIDPHGIETKYKLQIDTTGHFDFDRPSSCLLLVSVHPCSFVPHQGEPLPPGLVEPPEGELPAVEGGQVVSIDMSEGATLQPGTTYHFRAIAANGAPVIAGEDIQFTTPAASPLPEVPPITGGLQAPLTAVLVLPGVSTGPVVTATAPRQNRHKHHRKKHRPRKDRRGRASK